MQHILGKSYFAEKVADVQSKAAMTQQAAISQDVKQENERRSQSVNETEHAEGKTVDDKEKRRSEEEERKKRERKKDIAKRIARDTGHIIDLEA